MNTQELKDLKMVKRNGCALEYVKKQTPEICMSAVKQNGRALYYVKEQTHDICLAAVKQDGDALYFVKDKTPDICLAAVKQRGYALDYVEEQTLDICLEAVQQNIVALRYVKEQTPDICMTAVKQDGCALKYVKEQTHDVCLAAVKQHGGALQYVEAQTHDICMAAMRRGDVTDCIYKTDLIKESTRLEYKPNQTYSLCDILNLEKDSTHLHVIPYKMAYTNENDTKLEVDVSVSSIDLDGTHYINLLIKNDELTHVDDVILLKDMMIWSYMMDTLKLKSDDTNINLFIQSEKDKERIHHITTTETNYLDIMEDTIDIKQMDPMSLLMFSDEIF